MDVRVSKHLIPLVLAAWLLIASTAISAQDNPAPSPCPAISESADQPGRAAGVTDPDYNCERSFPCCPKVFRSSIPDSGQQFHHSFERHFIARVCHEPNERRHILDMGLLEKPDAAGDLIGNAAARQLELQFDRMIVRAIEHGDIV